MSLYKRSETGPWYYLFYVAGRRHKASTKTRNEKEAERIEKRAYAAAEKGESLTPQKAPVVRDFIKKFLEWNELASMELKTKSDYRNGCRLILASRLAGMRLDQLAQDDIETTRFHSSPYSTNCALRTMRRALHKALDWKDVREIPKVKLLKVDRRERMVTDEDEARLLKAIDHAASIRRYKNRAASPLNDFLMFLLDTGMRPSEVTRMRIELVAWEKATYFNLKGKTKGARRTVPLSKRVLALLKVRCGDRKEGWVFPSKKSPSGHIELRGLQKHFRNIARSLNIPEELKLYCSRHTFGTVTMAETRNPGLIKEAMGHEDLTTTMTYLHPDVSEIKRVIDNRNDKKADWVTAPITAPLQ